MNYKKQFLTEIRTRDDSLSSDIITWSGHSKTIHYKGIVCINGYSENETKPNNVKILILTQQK